MQILEGESVNNKEKLKTESLLKQSFGCITTSSQKIENLIQSTRISFDMLSKKHFISKIHFMTKSIRAEGQRETSQSEGHTGRQLCIHMRPIFNAFSSVKSSVFPTHIHMLYTLSSSLDFGLWCLTPLSTIFQLYRDGQYYWWQKSKYTVVNPTTIRLRSRP